MLLGHHGHARPENRREKNDTVTGLPNDRFVAQLALGRCTGQKDRVASRGTDVV
ncbi:hypothetical protein GCM10012275_16410 [Longimycelium tulufanense]|uniref:Uncharacterized protein n=1 Tax=Longimycelium tulufanense TaxID=907463 RepID=A0A8J3CC68_9PSEU|nr:hypothetical protein GCM10012275_16410 [Longimycelium tulufanense]